MVNVSIIVTCLEEQSQLRRLLPQLLSQQYEGEFEVIVVDQKHDKDLDEWLEETERDYPHLSHTFCPASVRGIDIRKLALTLGAKAANYEWLVCLSAGEGWGSDDWLTRLTACCGDGIDVVIGKKSRRRLWKRPSFNFFRRSVSLFKPTSSIILCRRSTLLLGQNVKLSNCKIVKL